MASASRRQAASLIEALFSEPQRFEFFAAMRLLQRVARLRRRRDGRADADPEEPVRLRTSPSLAFPNAEITTLKPAEGGAVADMEVAFMGLNGPSGVMPRHYSELVQRQIRERSFALRDFFDIFNHRAVLFHYLAWRKYRLAPSFESENGEHDPITAALYALIGFGTDGLRDRLAVEDATLIHYGGMFTQRTRSAAGLEAILSDYLARPVEVIQFVGRWSPLQPQDWTRLVSRILPFGSYACLGSDAVAGQRVWDVQGGIRLRLGPLDYRGFGELLPNSPLMREIAALTRTYIGPEFAFDVELLLRGSDVPLCTLANDGDFLPRLGWNTWLHAPSRPPIVADAVMRFATI